MCRCVGWDDPPALYVAAFMMQSALLCAVPAAAPKSPVSDDPSPRTIHVVAAAVPRPASAAEGLQRINLADTLRGSRSHPRPTEAQEPGDRKVAVRGDSRGQHLYDRRHVSHASAICSHAEGVAGVAHELVRRRHPLSLRRRRGELRRKSRRAHLDDQVRLSLRIRSDLFHVDGMPIPELL